MPTAQKRVRATRRPAALAAALAVVAVLVPAAPALAQSGSVTPRGPETADTQVTYDFECHFDGDQQSTGAKWRLNSVFGNEVKDGVVTDFTVNTLKDRVGSFTVDYTGVEESTYTLYIDCIQSPSGYWPRWRQVDLVAPAVATTTQLSVDQARVVAGRDVTLTATVSDGTGSVTFFGGGSPLATRPVSGRVATYTVPVAAATTFTATYQPDAGFQGSTSGGVSVDVVTDVTAPPAPALPAHVRVGEPVTAPTGGWEPADLTYTYVWKVAGTPVGTGPGYTPQPADLGKALTVDVTGTHPDLAPGTAKTVTSSAATVDRGSITTGYLELDGTVGDHRAVLGQTLTPRPVGWGDDAAFQYEWFVGDNEFSIAGATYTPVTADLGKRIRVRATVTAPGKTTVHDDAYAWSAVTTPTVTVGSSTIVVGRDAVVPVRVSGPTGGPVPTGDVDVTLTPKAGGEPVRLDASLTAGATSVTVHGLDVGTYAVAATYLPTPDRLPSYPLGDTPAPSNPYTTASGTGTVTVTKVTPAVTSPTAITVPVATPATFDVTVTGKPLPREYVIREGDTVLGQGQLATDGRIGVVLPVLAPGTHTVVIETAATATTAASSRTVTVVVGGEPVRVGALPTAQLDTPKAATAPGQQMELVAEGFEPGESVAFYLHSDPVFLGTAVADANGVARLLADIPADVPTGAHTVIATGGTSGRWATLAVELAVPAAAPTAASPAAAGPDLAVTGAQSGALMAGAWLMLLVGGALVLVARRVRATR